MTYIQCFWNNNKRTLETVDEFDTLKEAKQMLKEYRMSDPTGQFYLSSRCCANWN